MFMGEYSHTVDAKGRVFMPARFREELGEKFIVTKGLDHCLFVFPQKEWHVIEEKIKALPFTNQDARAFVRLFFAGAAEGEQDKQGRVLLPNHLREYAKIDKEVVIVGVGTRVEIWSQELWTNYCNGAQAAYEEIAEKMVNFLI